MFHVNTVNGVAASSGDEPGDGPATLAFFGGAPTLPPLDSDILLFPVIDNIVVVAVTCAWVRCDAHAHDAQRRPGPRGREGVIPNARTPTAAAAAAQRSTPRRRPGKAADTLGTFSKTYLVTLAQQPILRDNARTTRTAFHRKGFSNFFQKPFLWA